MNYSIELQNKQYEVRDRANFIPWPLQNIQQSIPEQFQRQVKLNGDGPAIKDGDRQLTYNELNCWSNQIAHALLSHRGHLGSEPIALLFDTGTAMIAAMLGVLKAGKFYVPLDISLPESRLLMILEDSQAQLILSDRQNLDALKFDPNQLASNILTTDNLDRFSGDNLDLKIQPDDLAYIIYTSGSTGKPKGVLQNHRYVLNLCRNYTNSGKITSEDSFSLLYSAAFGGAVRDIYCSLLNGAALFPLNVKQIGLHQLGRWLQDNEITVMFVVATLFRHFVATLSGEERFSQLRLIQIGSETVYRRDGELFQQHFADHASLIVNLGGTEISPIRQFVVTKDTVLTGSTIPAGYQVGGTEVLLWDELGEEVAEGEVGEIVVSSRQLALGYWQKKAITERAFIQKDQRTYFKTGDLGKLLPDGCLLHLGRKDFQVKIRGYRVETSEVEAALLNLESVKEAVVVAFADPNGAVGDLVLVAYLTSVNSGNKTTAKALKATLEEFLPSYMIPACFIWLESLPLTMTGKVNRRALPEPKSLLSTPQLDIIPPRNRTEEILVDIWSEVLKLKPIGILNNFFDLGGHSLDASQVMARISDRLKVNLPLQLMFQAPTIEQLAEFIETKEVNNTSSLSAPALTNNETNLPLSFAQQRLWFLDRLGTNKSVYNLLRGFRLTGEVDMECLTRAIQNIVQRHSILRTKFNLVDGLPVQEIATSLPFELSVVDLRNLARAERLSQLELAVQELQNWNFDLTQTPLFEMRLIHLDSQEHYLLVTMHHIISDDWSMQVFFRELSVNYQAYIQDRTSPLSPLPIQYSDYAQWQHQWLSRELSDGLSYWEQQLADAPVLDLPTDFPRTSEQDFIAGVVPIEIDLAVTQHLQNLSKRSRSTLFVTLLTAFAVLLSRYSNQEDVVIGKGVANRNRVTIEQLIGFFVSTLALRVRLSDNLTFLELVQQVHQTALDGYAHADVPFDRVVERLNIERHPSHHPLFQVMFLLQNVTQQNLELPGLETEQLNFDRPTAGATFDLTLSLKETAEGGLKGTFEYDTQLFARETISRMAKHFQTLLKAIVETPEQSINLFPLLTPSEISLLLPQPKAISEPPASCLHQWFEERVAQNPNAIAVRYGESQLTYQELNEQANQLAHYLQLKGVKPDTLVGICLERSLFMVVSILGILKAGAAYVPLDPNYPQSRLAYTVNDAEIKIIVTQSEFIERLSECEQYVCWDTDAQAIAEQSSENLVSEVRSHNLAYVIYTSGSTGQPKGVLVTHSNVTRLFTATEPWYNFSDRDVWTQFHSYAFDFSVWELWGALLYGGKLVVVPYWTSRDPAAFYQLLIDEEVTVLNQTPSAFYQLSAVDEGLKAKLNLRLIIFGGEALNLPNLKPWFEGHGDNYPQLVNMYGITETTVHVTYRPLSLADVEAKDSPIGVSIPDLQIYLLDSSGQPVPRGVRGEMYVGGGGVTRGYLNRAELTKERFIDNPFNSGTKLYKTGDLARFLPSGELEYLGRIDKQVKLRGFRIELGEIEAILSQHPAIGESLVRVKEEDKQLVAYVVRDRSLTLQEDPKGLAPNVASDRALIKEIRQYLKQKLPEYMVPNAIAILEKFPLTINGKVDFAALPKPDRQLQIDTASEKPQTEIEKQIASVWKALLGIEQVGIDDNFFELGGHSLLLVQLHQQLQSIFTTDLSIVEMFQYPTIQALAQRLSQQPLSSPSPKNKDSSVPTRDRTALLKQRKRLRQKHRNQKSQ